MHFFLRNRVVPILVVELALLATILTCGGGVSIWRALRPEHPVVSFRLGRALVAIVWWDHGRNLSSFLRMALVLCPSLLLILSTILTPVLSISPASVRII